MTSESLQSRYGVLKTDLAALDQLGRVVCLVVGALLGVGYAVFQVRPNDGGLFWSAGHSAHYYGAVWSFDAAFVYPPPLAQWAGLFPWVMFIVPWMVLVFASLWYATRWLAAPIVVIGALASVLGGDDLRFMASPFIQSAVGNPQAIIAAAIVLGFRHPATWAVVVLTKIGPGLGLTWFLARREWRSFAIACVATATVAALSFAAAPAAWAEFLGFAAANVETTSPLPVVPVPLIVRVPMALALVFWGARTIDDGWCRSPLDGRLLPSMRGRI